MREITLNEAAELAGCSYYPLFQRVKEGKLPARRVGNKMWVVKEKDVLRLKEAGELSRKVGRPRVDNPVRPRPTP